MSKPVRCAIYTRKSTEEGLDQAFNSLDAQREACAAYILSQRHEGWTLLPDLYDDGGFSGGNMERPGLKQLLADVAAGKIDVIVVYKVDRLTRSLADFSKIVEVLESAGTSFVSVTQAFNTTTSMGRLMLNVLLSFAQFEREVTGERIRDKIAASKRKGLWMGGLVPLGYALDDRKLVPHSDEAETVRTIFERYRALGSMRALARELRERGIHTRRYVFQDGREAGGNIFTLGPLAYLLKNPIYIGEVRHRGERFLGAHAPIVASELWSDVQAMLAGQAPALGSFPRATEASLLMGMIIDGAGRAMVPSHAVKQAPDRSEASRRRYRYYVTRTDDVTITDSWRVPAALIEGAVLDQLARWLNSTRELARDLTGGIIEPALIANARALGERLTTITTAERCKLLQELGTLVLLHPDRIALSLSRAKVMAELGHPEAGDADERVHLVIPATLKRRGNELRMAFAPDDHRAPAAIDPKLIKLLAEAEQAFTVLTTSSGPAERWRRNHHVRIARLKFLAPDIVAAILAGRQPPALTRQHLSRIGALPLDWNAQREMLGFA